MDKAKRNNPYHFAVQIIQRGNRGGALLGRRIGRCSRSLRFTNISQFDLELRPGARFD
jgi:hypothetical protein